MHSCANDVHSNVFCPSQPDALSRNPNSFKDKIVAMHADSNAEDDEEVAMDDLPEREEPKGLTSAETAALAAVSSRLPM